MSCLKYIWMNRLWYSVISIKRIRNENRLILLGLKLFIFFFCLKRYLINNNVNIK